MVRTLAGEHHAGPTVLAPLAEVLPRPDDVPLPTDRVRVEDDAVAAVQEAQAEVEIFAAELPAAREGRVEAAKTQEEVSR